MARQESDLVKNILLFSKALRKKNVGVTTDNVMDALKGLSLIDVWKRGDFRCLLRSNFVSRREEMEPFDDLFEKFWAFEEGRDQAGKKAGKKESADSEQEEGDLFLRRQREKLELIGWTEGGEEEKGSKETDLPAYSPEELLGRKDFRFLRDEV